MHKDWRENQNDENENRHFMNILILAINPKLKSKVNEEKLERNAYGFNNLILSFALVLTVLHLD